MFEADLRPGELRGPGMERQEKPFQVLCILLELERSDPDVWEALGDSADNPSFIETLLWRVSRFMA